MFVATPGLGVATFFYVAIRGWYSRISGCLPLFGTGMGEVTNAMKTPVPATFTSVNVQNLQKKLYRTP